MMLSMFQTSGSLLLFCGTDLKNLHNYGKKKIWTKWEFSKREIFYRTLFDECESLIDETEHCWNPLLDPKFLFERTICCLLLRQLQLSTAATGVTTTIYIQLLYTSQKYLTICKNVVRARKRAFDRTVSVPLQVRTDDDADNEGVMMVTGG